jgi:hypothetical protein
MIVAVTRIAAADRARCRIGAPDQGGQNAASDRPLSLTVVHHVARQGGWGCVGAPSRPGEPLAAMPVEKCEADVLRTVALADAAS